ncbi:MAG: hypothetical protein HQK51_11835 [Oligoflexia bacterium]|nr:hypothetical protein [Oligoflexia bacterium]
MSELDLIANEVSTSFEIGTSKKQRKYSEQLKEKVIAAVAKYGRRKVAEATGISNSAIWEWVAKTKNKKLKLKKLQSTKCRPIIIKELPRIDTLTSKEAFTKFSILKLTSVSGASLELNVCNGQDIISIVNIFMGSAK